jgi:class 3 adenylate cyclase
MVTFSGVLQSYCIGMIDMASSTLISSRLKPKDVAEYYHIFINFMSGIIERFNGRIIKNIGDSLLYYFPDSLDAQTLEAIRQCLDCNLHMLGMHPALNDIYRQESLPEINYRISCDYGRVMLMKPADSDRYDMIGPTINMCSKINRITKHNEIVVGGDLYQIASRLKNYRFKEIRPYNLDLNFDYPTYSLVA